MSDLEGLSDPQLVVALAQGAHETMAEAYRRHAGAVFGLARRVTGDASGAEDVTQEVFVDLWKHPERFDAGRGSLRTFLMTNAHSRAVDSLRSESARATREIRQAAERVNGTYGADRELEDLVVADQVTQAVAALSSEERTAIELAYFDGHTYREVARILSEPEGTIKTRIRSALRRMRGVLSDPVVHGGPAEHE